jgi:DNA-binding transcriptional LysR family regulator
VRDATSVSDPEVGTVRLAAVTTAAERLLLPLLAAFRRAHPGARIDLDVGNRSTVWAALRAHEVDLVVAGRPPVAAPARVLGLAPNRLVVVGPDGPPSSRSDGAAVAALADQTWLLREDGSGTREATDELLAGLGITPPTMLLGSNGAVARAAATGLGVTLVSTSAVPDELADGSLVVWPCPGTPLERPWHLVSHRDVALSPTAILLLRVLRESGGFALEPEAARLLRS